MVFPETAQTIVTEMLIDGVWTDITAEPVYSRDSINITRGLPDGANETPPGRCTFTVNNRNGKFSPRNPVSPYYKLIGRNTPVRVRLPDIATGVPYFAIYRFSLGGWRSVDSVQLSVVNVLDLRAELEFDYNTGTDDNWTTGTPSLAAKYETDSDQRAWAWWLDNGTIRIRTNGTGALAGNVDWQSSAAVPFTGTDHGAVRVTFENNDGSGNRRVTFYTAATLAGPWTQLGVAFILAGTAPLFDSTAPVEVGLVTDITVGDFQGRLYGFEMYSDLGTTLAGELDPAESAGTSDITDPQGNVWTSVGGAFGVNPKIRFTGEVSAWPQEWDPSGNDIFVRLEAGGILRRLTQGQPTLSSAMFRGVTAVGSNVVAYWPLEDEAGALSLASGLGGPPMTCSVPPEAASYSGFSSSKPVAQTPSTSPGTWRGGVPLYSSPSGSHMIRFMVHFVTGTTNGTTLLRVVVSSAQVGYFELSYDSGTNGQIRFRAFDTSGTEIVNQLSVTTGGMNGKNMYIGLDLEDTGTGLHWNVLDLDMDLPAGAGGFFFDGTLASTNIARVRAVEIMPNSTAAPGEAIAFGHVSVQHGITSFFELGDQVKGWIGETAGDRFIRLCAENDIASAVIGDPISTQAMGAQPVATLVDLLKQCAVAEVGIMYEPRDFLGVALRTRASLYNQAPVLGLDYTTYPFTRFVPIDDDQLTRNDITVSRPGGSSARVVQTTGLMSVNQPPLGVGIYDDVVETNIVSDAELVDHAGFRVRLGTVDASRFPDLALTMARTQLAAKRSDVALLDIGDRVSILNPPADRMPPDDLTQLAHGLIETISQYVWDVVINAVPEEGWRAAAWADDSAVAGDPDTYRYAPDASDLAVTADSTQTTILVNTSLGPLWTTDADDYPQDIWVDGEVCQLTAVGTQPAFVGIGTSATANNASVTPGLPAGVAVDDVVLIFASIRNSGTGVPVRPDGWYEALNFSAGNCRLYARRYDGAWTMPTITFTGGAAGADTIAQSVAFRGVDWPAISALSQLNGSAQSISTPSLPIPEWAGVVLGLGWKQDDWTGVGTLGRAWTEIEEADSVLGSDAGQVWDYQTAPPCATQAEASSFFVSGGVAAISRGAVICLPTKTPAVNSNPYFETDALGYTATSGVTLARSTAQAHSGAASGLLSTVGTPANWSITSQSIVPSIQGQLWTATAWVYTSTTLSLRVVLAWADETGTALSITSGTTTSVAAAIWTPLTVTGFSPTGTGFAQIRLQALTNPPAGSTCHADEIELTSPRIQGFTVMRSVNGVVKSHTEGTDVRVNPESFWAL